jgi:hypothetical protein
MHISLLLIKLKTQLSPKEQYSTVYFQDFSRISDFLPDLVFQNQEKMTKIKKKEMERISIMGWQERLLEGCKSIRLWSPAHAHNMYTYGRIVKVHPNGRIVYEGQVR